MRREEKIFSIRKRESDEEFIAMIHELETSEISPLPIEELKKIADSLTIEQIQLWLENKEYHIGYGLEGKSVVMSDLSHPSFKYIAVKISRGFKLENEFNLLKEINTYKGHVTVPLVIELKTPWTMVMERVPGFDFQRLVDHGYVFEHSLFEEVAIQLDDLNRNFEILHNDLRLSNFMASEPVFDMNAKKVRNAGVYLIDFGNASHFNEVLAETEGSQIRTRMKGVYKKYLVPPGVG